MTRRFQPLSGAIHPALYPFVAAALILAQHGYVAAAFTLVGEPIPFDGRLLQSTVYEQFWLFPMRSLMGLLDSHSALVAGGFFWCLLCSLALAVISFRRANWSNSGHGAALLAMVPLIQIISAAVLTFMPRFHAVDEEQATATYDNALARRQMLIGLASGTSLIVMAVVVSANMLGAYGIGLFVATPLLVGLTTGYAVNHGQPRTKSSTTNMVMAAGLLGTLALLMLALEGLMCIILVAPLAAALATLGGLLGRSVAIAVHHPNSPLISLAALPLLFLIDAALPPEVPIMARESITIAAPPATVWRALTQDHAIATPPGPVGLAGLAYPLSSHFVGQGVGAVRIGEFSTGRARETITAWQPERLLAFSGQNHPPAMEEMSPYRRVHAPHVSGYFDTLDTQFRLTPLADGGTRVTLESRHILRIDPVPYWGPIARWAIGQNMQRVLADLRDRSVATPATLSSLRL